MNHLKFLGLCLICFLVCTRISAQNARIPINEPDTSKPKLFRDLPNQIPVNIEEINTLLKANPEGGKPMTLELKEKTIPGLRGKVISITSKYNNTIRTLIIRSSNFNGATLTLSSFTQPDGTVKYSGRIISFRHSDAYVLEKQDDKYFLIKKKFNDLVNE